MNMYSQRPWLSSLGWSLVISWMITKFMYIAKERCPLAIWMPQNASAVGSVFDWLQSAADMRSGKNGESGVIQHSIFPLWRHAAWVREVFVLLAVIPRPFLRFSLNRCEKLDSLMYPIRHLNWDNKHFRWQRFNRGGLDCSIQVGQSHDGAFFSEFVLIAVLTVLHREMKWFCRAPLPSRRNTRSSVLLLRDLAAGSAGLNPPPTAR